MADSNLQIGGIADVLNGIGQGYLQGQQTVMARRAAAANMMRQQLAFGVQQQKADAQDAHNRLMEDHYANMDKNGAQRVDYYGDHGLTEALQRYDMGAGGGKLPPDQYYQGVKNLVKTYGKDPAQYGVPPQFLDGYTPPPNADGTPGTAPTVDPNALVGPTARAKNDQVTALGGFETAKTGALNLKSLEGLLTAVGNKPAADQGPYLQGLYVADPTTPKVPIPGVTQVGQFQPPIQGPGRGGAPIGLTSDPASIGQQVVPPISPIMARPYSPDVKTAAQIDNLNSLDKYRMAELPLVKSRADLNNGLRSLIPGRKTLLGAQANNAQSMADLRAGILKALPDMDASIMARNNGVITPQAAARIMGMMQTPHIGPTGDVTYAKDQNSGLYEQLGQIANGGYVPSSTAGKSGGKGGGVNPSAKAAARQLLGQ